MSFLINVAISAVVFVFGMFSGMIIMAGWYVRKGLTYKKTNKDLRGLDHFKDMDNDG